MLNVVTEFGDTVHLELAEGATIEVSGHVPEGLALELPEGFGDPEINLAARALRRFGQHFQLDLGGRIAIVKRIPAGGGLGGGSSDAAAVLRGAAAWGVSQGRIAPDDVATGLAEVALQTGADVPYLLYGGAAAVSGIGEVIRPIAVSGESVECLLVFPRVSVPTVEVFRLFRDQGRLARADAEIARLGSACCYEDLFGLMRNDLEEVVTEAFPEVGEVLNRLRGVPGGQAGMTGSGSTLFLLPAGGQRCFNRGVAELAGQAAGAPVMRTRILLQAHD